MAIAEVAEAPDIGAIFLIFCDLAVGGHWYDNAGEAEHEDEDPDENGRPA